MRMKLAELRQQRLISVMELARAAGVAHQAVLSIERGESKPKRMETVRKISRALDVPAAIIDEFQHLAGTMDALNARMVQQHGAQVLAAIERANREGWIPFEQVEQELEAQPDPA